MTVIHQKLSFNTRMLAASAPESAYLDHLVLIFEAMVSVVYDAEGGVLSTELQNDTTQVAPKRSTHWQKAE